MFFNHLARYERKKMTSPDTEQNPKISKKIACANLSQLQYWADGEKVIATLQYNKHIHRMIDQSLQALGLKHFPAKFKEGTILPHPGNIVLEASSDTDYAITKQDASGISVLATELYLSASGAKKLANEMAKERIKPPGALQAFAPTHAIG